MTKTTKPTPSNIRKELDEKTANDELEMALNQTRTKVDSEDEFERDIALVSGLRAEDTSTQSVQASLPRMGGGINTSNDVEGYEELRLILELAYDQSARGKGKERHSVGSVGSRPWVNQPILEISRMVGPGYAAGQVAKKVQEAVTMAGNGNYRGAQAEALGAIVYAAALYRLLSEMDLDRKG